MPKHIETKALNFHFGFYPDTFKWKKKGRRWDEQEKERPLRNTENRVCPKFYREMRV